MSLILMRDLQFQWLDTKEVGKGTVYTRIHRYNVKGRIGTAWFRLGIWKLKGIRRGTGKGRCPSCNEEENDTHTLLYIMPHKRWKNFLSNKWLNIIK
jgi:hypothetical protein